MEGQLKILVVEDDDGDFDLMKIALKESRAATIVARAHDGVEATEFLSGKGKFADSDKWERPDVIVMDLKMPRMSGHDLLQWIKDHPEKRIIPTLVLSSSRHPSDIQKAYELGATTYFEKPISLEDFLDLFKLIARYWSVGLTSAKISDFRTRKGATQVWTGQAAS